MLSVLLILGPQHSRARLLYYPHNLDRASKLYIQAATASGQSNAIERSLSPDFCYYAVRAPANDPLSAASINCQLYSEQTQFIYNNL